MMRRLCFIFLAVIVLNSCVDIQTELLIRKNGQIDIKMVYTIDEKSAGFGHGFAADEPWALPLTWKDFRLQALRTPGMQLKKYKRKVLKDGGERITVDLEAQSMESLANYFNWPLKLSGTSDSGSFSIDFPSGQLSEDYVAMFKQQVGDYRYAMKITTPVKPKNIQGGNLLKGRVVSFETSLYDVLSSENPIIWSVSW